jgi:hypothetical protein
LAHGDDEQSWASRGYSYYAALDYLKLLRFRGDGRERLPYYGEEAGRLLEVNMTFLHCFSYGRAYSGFNSAGLKYLMERQVVNYCNGDHDDNVDIYGKPRPRGFARAQKNNFRLGVDRFCGRKKLFSQLRRNSCKDQQKESSLSESSTERPV